MVPCNVRNSPISLDEGQRRALRELAGDIDGIDTAAYARYGRDPLEPIIGLGPPAARIGFFGRDPGRDEVKYGEPFIGAGGQLLRRTIYRHLTGEDMPGLEAGLEVGRSFFWANTVPYKPVGNKAWPMKIKRRFQPLMRELLLERWRGHAVITLGREAFLWFGIGQPNAERQRIEMFWKRADRFRSSLAVVLSLAGGGHRRVFMIYPLPHPSPLNANWVARFPELLCGRLHELDARPGRLGSDSRLE